MPNQFVNELDNREMEKKPLFTKPNFGRPLLASFLASIMSFASGTVVGGWTPPETPQIAGDYMFLSENMEKSSWVVSVYVFGALVGAMPAGRWSRSIGRKRFLLALAVPMTVGWLLIAIYPEYTYVIYAGRLVCGLSLGAVTVAVPLYTHDVAPDACRGRGGVFLDLMLCAGVLYSYTVSSVAGLRAFSLTCVAVPVAFAALFAAMPESPRSLYGRGRYADAKSALIWLRGKDFDVQEEFNKFAIPQDDDNYESSGDELPTIDDKHQNRKQIFTKGIVLSLALATIQRMSGAGAIIQFTAKLFKISGSSVQPITASIITGVFQLFGSVAALVLVDKMGRRKLLLISSTVVTACLFMLALYFYYLNNGTLADPLKVLPVFIVCAYIAFFRIGLGPVPWFMTAKLLLGSGRENSRGQSLVASYSWILSFAVMQSFIPLVNSWPVLLWFGYGVLSAAGALFVLFLVPETNNKSADQVRSSLTATTWQVTCRSKVAS